MKKEMVTRTIISTKVTVLGVNEETGETENKTYTFAGTVKDNEKALAKVKKANDDPLYHPALVVSLEPMEELLGVELDKFIEMAVPVTRPKSQTKNKEAAN